MKSAVKVNRKQSQINPKAVEGKLENRKTRSHKKYIGKGAFL